MLKQIVTGIIISSYACSQTYVTEDMIYNGVIDAIKRIPESVANLGNFIYKTEIKKEKSYTWYFKENNKLKKKLKEKNIDYYTILKQGMYPRKVYDNSREAEIKKYAILTAMAEENGIIKTEKKKKEKKKLNIITTDIYKLKKN